LDSTRDFVTRILPRKERLRSERKEILEEIFLEREDQRERVFSSSIGMITPRMFKEFVRGGELGGGENVEGDRGRREDLEMLI
jgi:hypothetical protein